MNKKIDFICIGAQKAGTTWLWDILSKIEGFDFPPIKELHYFDKSPAYPSPSHLNTPRLVDRLFDKRWVWYFFRDSRQRWGWTNWEQKKWLMNWYFSNYSDEWYISLFKSYKGITGEFTVSYAYLDSSDVKRMRDLLPDVKIIFMLRNPIERAWSHYRFIEMKHGTQKQEFNKIKEFLDSQWQELGSDYLRTIENYSKFYNKEQILIGFYDAIKVDSDNLLTDIIQFIGGDPTRIKQEDFSKKKVNVSVDMDMPIEVKAYLRDKYYKLIENLSKQLGSYSLEWFNELNGIEPTSEVIHKPTIRL